MINPPTGRLVDADGGHDLVLTRTFKAPIADVWASVTESDRTARWFGRWEGDAAPGNTVRLWMTHEEGNPEMRVRIDACEPPRRLVVSTTDEAGAWRLELLLAYADGSTGLTMIHRGVDVAGIGEVGPGWEYYLDVLAASRDDAPLPGFDDYYPAMKPHFEALR